MNYEQVIQQLQLDKKARVNSDPNVQEWFNRLLRAFELSDFDAIPTRTVDLQKVGGIISPCVLDWVEDMADSSFFSVEIELVARESPKWEGCFFVPSTLSKEESDKMVKQEAQKMLNDFVSKRVSLKVNRQG